MMIERAVQRSLDRKSLSKIVAQENGESVQRIIKVAVLNSKMAHRGNYEALVAAVRATLQDDIPEKIVENAVMEAIREKESRPRQRHLEMSRFQFILFFIFMMNISLQGDVPVAAGNWPAAGGGAPHLPLRQKDQRGPETRGTQMLTGITHHVTHCRPSRRALRAMHTLQLRLAQTSKTLLLKTRKKKNVD